MIQIKVFDSNNMLNNCTVKQLNNSKDLAICDVDDRVIVSCASLDELILAAESISCYLEYQSHKIKTAAPNRSSNIENACKIYFDKQYPNTDMAHARYTNIFDRFQNSVVSLMATNPDVTLDDAIKIEFDKIEEETVG